MSEIWKTLNTICSDYEISNYGNVRSKDRIVINKLGVKRFYLGKNLNPNLNKSGYLQVDIKGKNYRVHRLVALAFIENERIEAIEINHIDGVKTNNSVTNLEWCTSKENKLHAYRVLGIKPNTDHMKGRFGKLHHNSKKVMATKNGINYFFEGLHDAQRKLGIDKSNISAVCRGVQKTAGGYVWKFI